MKVDKCSMCGELLDEYAIVGGGKVCIPCKGIGVKK